MHFLHLADLHLDSPFQGLADLPPVWLDRLRTAGLTALERVVDAALAEEVDAVLIAGDVFDGSKRSLQAHLAFSEQMDRLGDRDIPVFLVHGNHDPLSSARLSLDLGDNVHVFGDQVETTFFYTKSGEEVAVTGYSYGKAWQEDRILSKYPIRSSQVDFHLGLLHGQLVSGREKSPYAPFEVKDINHLGYDYLALGHVHLFQAVTTAPPAYYSGALSGRSKKDQGPKGYIDIMFEGGQAQVTPMAVAPVTFDRLSISLQGIDSWQQAFRKILDQIHDFLPESDASLVELFLKDSQHLAPDQIEVLQGADFLSQLQGQVPNDFVWPYQVNLDQAKNDLSDLRRLFPAEFQAAQNRVEDPAYKKQLMDDLFDDDQARAWLDDLF